MLCAFPIRACVCQGVRHREYRIFNQIFVASDSRQVNARYGLGLGIELVGI